MASVTRAGLGAHGTETATDGVHGLARATAIVDANVAHAFMTVFTDTEVEAAMNSLGGKVNLILAALRDAGLVGP